MNSDQIETEHLVDRYLRDELDPNETAAFEERLLWDTDMQDSLELTRHLRDGLHDVATNNPATVQRRSLFHSPRYATAATVLLAVTTLGWLLTWFGMSDSQFASARVYSLDPLRGASQADLPQVIPGDSGEWLTLLVYPDLDDNQQFRAELARQAEGRQWQTIWQGDPADSGTGDTVAVTLQSTLLKPGVYRLRVTGWEQSQPGDLAAEVLFQVPTP